MRDLSRTMKPRLLHYVRNDRPPRDCLTLFAMTDHPFIFLYFPVVKSVIVVVWVQCPLSGPSLCFEKYPTLSCSPWIFCLGEVGATRRCSSQFLAEPLAVCRLGHRCGDYCLQGLSEFSLWALARIPPIFLLDRQRATIGLIRLLLLLYLLS